jgi:competence ComEA-like helix-hairpin-helix protein
MANTEQKNVRGPAEQTQTQSPHDVRPSAGALDLNTASEEQIAEIDMIGRKIAHAIVSRRAAQGPFSAWEDLQGVEGLDAKRLAELQRAARLIVS